MMPQALPQCARKKKIKDTHCHCQIVPFPTRQYTKATWSSTPIIHETGKGGNAEFICKKQIDLGTGVSCAMLVDTHKPQSVTSSYYERMIINYFKASYIHKYQQAMCSKSFIKFRVSKKATKGLTKSLSCFDVHCKKIQL